MVFLKQYKTIKSWIHVDRGIIVFKHWFMYPWNNFEDGLIAGDEHKDKPDWVRMLYWNVWRNPANGLRFIPYISCRLKPDKIRWKGKLTDNKPFTSLYDYDDDTRTFWLVCWQGLYSNIRFHLLFRKKIYRLWIGWKVHPKDSLGIDPNDYRKHGCGFAQQLKRVYPR